MPVTFTSWKEAWEYKDRMASEGKLAMIDSHPNGKDFLVTIMGNTPSITYKEKKDPSEYLSITELISDLEDNSTKRDIETYYNIATERKVTDYEVDKVFKSLCRKLKWFLKEGMEENKKPDPETWTGRADRILKEANKAVTRSDKIIAIDSIISFEHDNGRMLSSYFSAEDNSRKIDEILDRLASRKQ